MNDLPTCEVTPGARQFRRRIIVGMLGYAVVLMLAVTFVKAYPQSPWRYVVMLLPILPAMWSLVGVMKFLRAMDEMQRRVHMEGVAFAFLVTVVLAFSYGLLERAGMPNIPTIWVASLMIFLWGVGNYIAARRYR